MKNKKEIIVYILTILFSIGFIYFGNKYTSNDFDIFKNEINASTYRAVVIEIKNENEYIHEENLYEGTNISFLCKIISGDKKGEKVIANQPIDTYDAIQYKKVEPHDKILINNIQNEDEITWLFSEYDRTNPIKYLFITFVLMLLFFGRKKGFNTIVSLVFTCIFIFYVFIPSVLSGLNIYVWSVITCLAIVTMNLIIVNGLDKKTAATMIGCIGGLIISGILAMIMDKTLNLTGMVDENAFYLSNMDLESKINLKAIIFAGILIGALGAVMDVSMSISSSLYEVNIKTKLNSKYEIIKSGINIGRDIMGTMTNTLILAYIGSSLSSALLLTMNNYNFTELLNREMVIVEILQALIGSIGILITIIITAIACSILFYDNDDNKYDSIDEADEADIEWFLSDNNK